MYPVHVELSLLFILLAEWASNFLSHQGDPNCNGCSPPWNLSAFNFSSSSSKVFQKPQICKRFPDKASGDPHRVELSRAEGAAEYLIGENSQDLCNVSAIQI